MRNKLIASGLAVLTMVAIVIIAIAFIDDDAEPPSNASAASPTPAVTPTPATSPTPEVREPNFAPDGRTDIAELDRIIDDFVTLDADALVDAYPDLTARQSGFATLSAPEWAALLESSERFLYAVLEPEDAPRDYYIVLSVRETDHAPAGWRIGVLQGQVIDLRSDSAEVRVGRDVYRGPMAYSGDVGANYDKFLVLPPLSELPRMPSSHSLTTTTEVANVDSVLSLVAAHDSAGAEAAAGSSLARLHCGHRDEQHADVTLRELREVVSQAVALHAVAEVPDGHQPAADHTIILFIELSPYDWQVASLLEANARIVGVDICRTDRPATLYPPRAFPVPPLPGTEDLDPARRSGIAIVDAFLDALEAGDVDTLAGLVHYTQMACVPGGVYFGPPSCGEGESEGTQVDVLFQTGCEGGYTRSDNVQPLLESVTEATRALYAVADLGEITSEIAVFRGTLVAVVADVSDEGRPPIAFYFDEEGLTAVAHGCRRSDPEGISTNGGLPNFLLPPP